MFSVKIRPMIHMYFSLFIDFCHEKHQKVGCIKKCLFFKKVRKNSTKLHIFENSHFSKYNRLKIQNVKNVKKHQKMSKNVVFSKKVLKII